jgi:death-on-curing protein
MEPSFIGIELVLAIHRNQIMLYGGSLGIRDRGALESAIAQAQATFGGSYLHEDVFEMAAAYFYHLTQNHPFLDGNKRAGAATAITFLAMNGYDLDPLSEDDLEALSMKVAQGQAAKHDVALFFRINTI